MKTILRALSLAVLALLAAGTVFAQANDPVLGYWKSFEEDGTPNAYWLIERLPNGTLSARSIYYISEPQDTKGDELDASYPNHPMRNVDLRTVPLRTVPLIYGMQYRSAGQWSRGWIIDPRDGTRYDLDLNFIPRSDRRAVNGLDTLEVKGKVFIFSKSEYWVRAQASEIPAEYRR